tara:strand:- start:606 stop:800 length:195 start_codon:yes stop_codon:yes gene_type:complete
VITVVAQALAVIAGLITLVVAWWKYYGSPKAKARRKARAEGKKAAEDLDPSGVTAAFDKMRKRP